MDNIQSYINKKRQYTLRAIGEKKDPRFIFYVLIDQVTENTFETIILGVCTPDKIDKLVERLERHANNIPSVLAKVMELSGCYNVQVKDEKF